MKHNIHPGLDYSSNGIRYSSLQSLNEEGEAAASASFENGHLVENIMAIPEFTGGFIDACKQWLKDNPTPKFSF